MLCFSRATSWFVHNNVSTWAGRPVPLLPQNDQSSMCVFICVRESEWGKASKSWCYYRLINSAQWAEGPGVSHSQRGTWKISISKRMGPFQIRPDSMTVGKNKKERRSCDEYEVSMYTHTITISKHQHCCCKTIQPCIHFLPFIQVLVKEIRQSSPDNCPRPHPQVQMCVLGFPWVSLQRSELLIWWD